MIETKWSMALYLTSFLLKRKGFYHFCPHSWTGRSTQTPQGASLALGSCTVKLRSRKPRKIDLGLTHYSDDPSILSVHSAQLQSCSCHHCVDPCMRYMMCTRTNGSIHEYNCILFQQASKLIDVRTSMWQNGVSRINLRPTSAFKYTHAQTREHICTHAHTRTNSRTLMHAHTQRHESPKHLHLVSDCEEVKTKFFWLLNQEFRLW